MVAGSMDRACNLPEYSDKKKRIIPCSLVPAGGKNKRGTKNTGNNHRQRNR